MTLNKKLMTAVAAASMVAASANAVQIDFGGSYHLSDSADVGTVRESISFPFGIVFAADPAGDSIEFNTVSIATLTINEASLTSTGASFAPNVYPGGFSVPGFFTADLTAVDLTILGSGGAINPFLVLNLSNIVADGGYVAGTSAVADAFLAGGAGATSITLQLAASQGGDLYAAIKNTGGSVGGPGTLINSFSGTASPVPDGGMTLALLGAGLMIVGGVTRKLR